MRVVFADSGYWIAMFNPVDSLHEKAETVTARLGIFRIVTTQMVLVEFFNFMSSKGGFLRETAVDAARSLENNPTVEIVEQTGIQFESALALYASRADQRWGITDCASFLLMEERGITEALAYDRDFEQAGFVALLREV